MFDSILGVSIIVNAITAIVIYTIYMVEERTTWLWGYQIVNDLKPYEAKLITLMLSSTYYTVVGGIVWLMLQL